MRSYLLYLMLLGSLFVTACGNDDESSMTPEDNRAVSVNVLALVVTGGSQGTQTFRYRQPLPPEPGIILPAEVEDIVLQANTSYTYRLLTTGESNFGATNYNNDIVADGEDYLFTFDVLAANLTVTPTDTDTFGDPIGLSGTMTTGAASSGVLMFDLYFETAKDAPGGTGDRLLGGNFRVEIQ